MELKGYTTLESNFTPRLIARISGHPKEGKTHLALTAPDPISYLNFDRSLEGVGNKFVDGTFGSKEILVTDFHDTRCATPEEHKAKWETVKEKYYTALESDEIRSIIIDNDKEAWDLIRMARFGKLVQIPPMAYGPVNREFKSMIDAAYDSDKNLILITRLKKQYVKRSKSPDAKSDWNGLYEPAGFNGMPYEVQVNVRSYWCEETREFGLEIVDCGHNSSVRGQTLTGEACSFPFLGVYVMPESNIEDWEG